MNDEDLQQYAVLASRYRTYARGWWTGAAVTTPNGTQPLDQDDSDTRQREARSRRSGACSGSRHDIDARSRFRFRRRTTDPTTLAIQTVFAVRMPERKSQPTTAVRECAVEGDTSRGDAPMTAVGERRAGSRRNGLMGVVLEAIDKLVAAGESHRRTRRGGRQRT